MTKVNTITRKITLNIADNFKESYEQLYAWNEQVFRAANTAASHLYFQNNMREFFYLTEEAKVLFTNVNKSEELLSEKERELINAGAVRVLNTSKQNSTYQVLSSIYKGKMPADIFTNLNAQLTATFGKEQKEYFSGKRSLRTYRRDMPIPFSSTSIRDIKATDDSKNYRFTLFGINFQTWFGRDRSGNKMILERALAGEYKLCNSSIQLDGKYVYLLAVFQFDSDKYNVDPEKVMEAELSSAFPIVLKHEEKSFKIGDKKEYLHRRYAIQGSLRRQQIAARYNVNGKGRKKKMVNTERFTSKEYDYVNTRQHQYTFKMIQLCLQNKCGKLLLKLTPEPPEPGELDRKELQEWRIENELLLRNWGYRGLKDKIAYKCKKVGIELVIEK